MCVCYPQLTGTLHSPYLFFSDCVTLSDSLTVCVRAYTSYWKQDNNDRQFLILRPFKKSYCKSLLSQHQIYHFKYFRVIFLYVHVIRGGSFVCTSLPILILLSLFPPPSPSSKGVRNEPELIESQKQLLGQVQWGRISCRGSSGGSWLLSRGGGQAG